MFLSEVYNIDCMDITAMRALPDKSIYLALCDIPYGIDVANMAYLKEVKKPVKQKNGSKLSPYNNKKKFKSKDWDKVVPSQEYFDELKRISERQIIFGIEYTNWTGVGSGRIRWDKGVAEGMSFNRYETAYCSCIDDVIDLPLLWNGMRQAKSLEEPMVQQGDKKLNEKRWHPCHKPTLLYIKLIRDYGYLGCTIIDTHVGGGSSRIAAYKCECPYLGYEIDKEYFNDQEKRFIDYKRQTRLQF
jgi:site-specific DNA-methyltransferase (adenine-specific)